MKTFYVVTVLFVVLVLVGCNINDWPEPPAVPRGLQTITGDGKVTLEWYPNEEHDLAGYKIWKSMTENGKYRLIASTRSTSYIDLDVENGVTYYYAVSAYDDSGNESELSRTTVQDTPRPEGKGVRLYDYHNVPDKAGYHFSEDGSVEAYDSEETDIYFDYDSNNGIGYMVTANTSPPTQIQDYGFTKSIKDVNWAPDGGWSPSGVVELIVGHAYVVWTWDNYFAAFRVTELGDGYVKFDWSYQTAKGNPELKILHRR